MNIQNWIKAFRLRTLPLALASVGMGSFLANYYGKLNYDVLIYSLITTVFLQILSNLANDYGDSVHGADHEGRKGPNRMVQSGFISQKAMKSAIILFAVLSFISGLLLIQAASIQSLYLVLFFVLLGIGAIASAIRYTMGKKPYGYAGLGDIFVLIFFGFTGVIGTFFLHTGFLKTILILPSLSVGFLSTAVLNVNNIRDLESDALAGKMSVPVRIGRKNAVWYHITLLSLAIISAVVFTLIEYNGVVQFLFLLSLPLLYINGRAISAHKDSSKLDPYLKQLALSALIFMLLFGMGLQLVA
ncbi:MAG: 1,4-dihydroxy-2-naphthoate polyprenyltransferase [Cyclobacteriaceae bacterium]|nr:1,4-dihydroxy-2-naphthoate polyprenyltransferase [Cyclobacteriaceae bacterium]